LTDLVKPIGTYIVYGSDNCQNCKVAVSILNQKNKPFIYKKFGEDYQIEELEELLPVPNRTIPQIFNIGEGNVLEYVGILPDLIKRLKD